MVFQQQRIAQREAPAAVTSEVASAAARYQRDREVEALQLAVMASHNLAGEWTPETRAAVIEAREHVRAARETRAAFRGEIREHVRALRSAREALPAILRSTRAMVQLLQSSGAIQDDGGWLEAEVLEWAIEEFEIIE
jgi:hypothetical protein